LTGELDDAISAVLKSSDSFNLREIFNKDLRKQNPFGGSFLTSLACVRCGWTNFVKVETMNDLIVNLGEVKKSIGGSKAMG
jgi:hypothetical protein